MKKLLKDKINIIISIFIIMIILLMYMFPLLHDDLLHGSVGLGFNFMPHVNGRYLGNFFSINLAANIVFGVITKSLIIILIIYISKKILNIKNNIYILLFLILFMFMPKEMFREVFPFTAGFSNYVIPIAGVLFIIHCHINNLFHKCKNYFIPLFIILGIFNSLFVEHITIFNLLLSIYLVVYEYVKNKKINYISLTYFIGSLLGTIIMFTNPTYLVTLNGTDEYRSFSTFKEILTKPWAILRAAFFHNIVINLLLIYLMTKVYIKQIKEKNLITKSLMIFLWLFGIYSLIKIVNTDWFFLTNYMKHFETLITFIFFVNIGYILYKSKILKNKEIYRLTFYAISMIFILAPLVMVSPLGPRCYIMVYIMMIIFVIDLFTILEVNKIIKINSLSNILMVIALCEIVFYLLIYGSIYIKNIERLKRINEDIGNKLTTIEIIDLPYSNYLHMGNVCSEYSELVFKEYYKIPNDVIIKGECR